ncbi:cobalamin biosynthesis protein CobD [Hyphomicrobium nitrativorans NL23]|uniref:Cobalamin biosynthesis protein CobD n=1 Tax=Hyphomicrobium nitrativorans NL23 TaxID=1029756 RepID=V5SEU8_9HYPH|nr:adenosylcobinamide-phosphate synthase CbiB [Hyphomicrobium nitrativorans]AHB48484.1 cobalamin biosynthesis protein CobD [Hyphomicrobium nitrativorans NL23]
MYASLALAGLAVEAVCGYPRWLFRAIGHPVSWIGRLIAWCDDAWNRPSHTFARRRLAGIGALAVCLAATTAVSVGLVLVTRSLVPEPLALVILGILASAFIAQRSLDEHVRAVACALETGTLDDARRAVAQIVGRDTTVLDTAAVSRASIESLSENFSDGIVAPVFWMVVGGLPGAALYKTINTADSMVGHKSERHLAFGWAAARLDDIVNLPASRLSALWIAAAASLLPGVSGRSALAAVRRDAPRHRSPNAGWPEAAMAGALGVRLAGPRSYGGETVDDHWMGTGPADATAADIRRALRIYRLACVIQAATVALLAAALAVTMPGALT